MWKSFRFEDYVPKSLICWREGYSKELFLGDLFAGISVGIIALPLALAFAIGSGVSPEKGLFTAIIAGFLISLLGGSRVQIGGPTGAFIVIVFSCVQKYGYEGLATATVIAGILMIAMGLARFGVLLKFIPYPVTTGFTTGIALTIFFSQLKDFFGMDISSLPPKFLEKCNIYCQFIHTWNPSAFALSLTTLISIFILRKYYPRLPGAIIAVIGATLIAQLFQLPLETIQSKFGEIPRMLPSPSLPQFSYASIKELFPEAIGIALLGAIESLLSAVVADGMTGYRHRSNCELVAQGFANIGSIIFGGIPATGAIARTTANIKLGGKTPMAGMIHAITLLLLMLLLAPFAVKIPLCALSAVLIFVAWNMSELGHFIEILKGPRSDALVLLTTFLLTVLIDLIVAVEIGVLLAAVLFLKHMTDATTVKISQLLVEENAHETPELRDGDILFRNDVPSNTAVFEITGPFFYSVADLLDEALRNLDHTPQYFILRMRKVPLIDSTGIQALKQFHAKCEKTGIQLLLSGVGPGIAPIIQKSGLEGLIGQAHIFPNIDEALKAVKNITRSDITRSLT